MDKISTKIADTVKKLPQGQSLQVQSWAVQMWQTTYFCYCTNFIPFKSLNLCFLFLQLSALLTARLYERVTQVSEIPNCSSFSDDTFCSLVCITSAADYLERGTLGTSVHLQPEQPNPSEERLEICLCMQAPKIITRTKKPERISNDDTKHKITTKKPNQAFIQHLNLQGDCLIGRVVTVCCGSLSGLEGYCIQDFLINHSQ